MGCARGHYLRLPLLPPLPRRPRSNQRFESHTHVAIRHQLTFNRYWKTGYQNQPSARAQHTSTHHSVGRTAMIIHLSGWVHGPNARTQKIKFGRQPDTPPPRVTAPNVWIIGKLTKIPQHQGLRSTPHYLPRWYHSPRLVRCSVKQGATRFRFPARWVF